MDAKTILFYGNKQVTQAVEKIPSSQWEISGVCGKWSAKDIIAHLAVYEHLFIDILESFLTNKTPQCASIMADFEKYNNTEVDKRKKETKDSVIEDYMTTHDRCIELLNKIAKKDLEEVGRISWYGDNYSLDDLIVYMYYGHKIEHATQIISFFDRK